MSFSFGEGRDEANTFRLGGVSYPNAFLAWLHNQLYLIPSSLGEGQG